MPVPGRGYWAKVEAGQLPRRTVFVEVQDRLLDHIKIHATSSRLLPEVKALVRRQRQARQKPKPPEAQTPTPVEPAPGTGSMDTSQPLHASLQKLNTALRQMLSRTSDPKKTVSRAGVIVTTVTLDRALALFNRLAHDGEPRGIAFAERQDTMIAVRGPDTVSFRLIEETENVPIPPTAKEIAEAERERKRNEELARRNPELAALGMYRTRDRTRTEKVPTGRLLFEIDGWGDGLRRRWRDNKTKQITAHADSILDSLDAWLTHKRNTREEEERRQLAEVELERRRELARARHQRERKRIGLLASLTRIERRIAQLQTRAAALDASADYASYPELQRMRSWIEREIGNLKAKAEPASIAKILRAENLFPEVDEFFDLLGDPPMGWRGYR